MTFIPETQLFDEISHPCHHCRRGHHCGRCAGFPPQTAGRLNILLLSMKISASNKTAIDLVVPFGLGALVFYSGYKKTGDYREPGIFALIITAVAYIITSQVTKQLMIAAADKVSASDRAQIAQESGATPAQVDAAQTRAKQIHQAFFGADGNAWTENESQAVSAINTATTVTDVILTSKMYQAAYGRSLAGDFDTYVHFWDGSVNSMISSNWF